jgi:hypothetical protein
MMSMDDSVARAEEEWETVCFVIHGKDLTRSARSRWADDREPARAIRLLLDGLHGIEIGQVLDVLTGKSKLTGSSRSGVEIVPDKALERAVRGA